MKITKMENKKIDTIIIGAGIAGLGAGAWLKGSNSNFIIFESDEKLPMNLHNGVHYFHELPDLPFRIEMKKINLTDGIIDGGKIYHEPNLKYSLKYSKKVREIQHPSSIMDVGKRKSVYIPDSNTADTILEECYNYIGKEKFAFGYKLRAINCEEKIATFEYSGSMIRVEYKNIISAVPLDAFRCLLSYKFIEDLELEFRPVYITNYKLDGIVPNWIINLYIPDMSTPMYRASIMNGACSVESTRELNGTEMADVIAFLDLFHFKDGMPQQFTWETGKVISISMDDRKRLVNELMKKSIYQIGRFGLWNRKLLMDTTIKQAKAVVEFLSGDNGIAEIWNKPKWSEVERLLVK